MTAAKSGAVEFTVDLSDLLQLFAEVTPHAGTDDTLPMLTCVRLELEGNELRAACIDRYTLAVSRLPLEHDDGEEPFAFPLQERLISTEAVTRLRRCFKPQRRVATFVRLSFTDDGLTVTETGTFGESNMTLTANWHDHAFPAFRNFLKKPQGEASSELAFDAHFMARFAHAARGAEPMRLMHGAHNKPAMIYFGDHFIGAIMPVRVPETAGDVWDLHAKASAPEADVPAPKKRASRARKSSAA